MKITIDTEQKTIKLEGQVKMSELIKKVYEMGVNPDEYEIVGTEKEVEYIPYYPAPMPVYPVYPSTPYPPWEIICNTSNTSMI